MEKIKKEGRAEDKADQKLNVCLVAICLGRCSLLLLSAATFRGGEVLIDSSLNA
jgi:hypothetical protein